MRPRALRHLSLAAALLVPLAFSPLLGPPRTGDHLDDGKARALAEAGADAHHVLDAAKAERAAQALAEADRFGVEVSTPAPCIAGFAGPYPCENVDLAAVVPLAELGGVAGNDSWGWTDPVTGREIALVGTGTGLTFVDVSEPTDPRILGRLESHRLDSRILWRDVKVDQDHAFIVSEVRGHGLQVFDLTRLRNSVGTQAKVFQPDAVYEEFGSAHNLAINTDTHFAYAVGSDTCEAGLHMVDISTPTEPTFAGCFDEDGYTHDVQCVLYSGPDPDHNGSRPGKGDKGDKADRGPAQAKARTGGPAAGAPAHAEPHEICFAANEDSVTIVDVTDKADPVMLSKITYDTAAYTHQGWLTPDQRWFVFNDELDEDPVLGAGSVDNTTTYMVNVEDLDLGLGEFGDNPHPQGRDGEFLGVSEGSDGEPLVKAYSHDTISIDHNLYITDDGTIWEANYNAGLRVLRYTEEGLQNGELEPVGFFDVDPGAEARAYGDSWNVYPFFDSGTVILSNIGQGLVILQPDYKAIRGG
jgi:choice-of-anchor B domain-containing protein